MTSARSPFPSRPLRGVHVLHRRINCAPHFAEITVDFEPAEAGFAFEVAGGVAEAAGAAYEPAEDLPRFFAAVASGMEERLRSTAQDHIRVGAVATRAVLRHVRADAFGSHELAFRIAGYLAATKALELEPDLEP
ncbi:hypothetical protein GCM10010218_15570 [Streptomyces mashuensis]|uniref:Translation elongation factor EFG/EF2 domain-containing protein n=1 Tax=Streptomyces mashuensis TaxID=33904 RepID=A0A919B1A4_9ACTN|nr:hypothetical protein [Streptomyces mashuensis]GHF35247.1 hypothetical protein GCM10010218_15570 [Streptomyces mashuensis]